MVALDDIKTSLNQEVQGSGLVLQVRQMGKQLVVMMNCPKQQADGHFQEMASKLLDKLKALALPNISDVKLYGRHEGNPQPEWQHTYPLAATVQPIQEDSSMTSSSTVKTFVQPRKASVNPQNILANLNAQGLLIPVLLAGILGVQLLSIMVTAMSQPGTVEWEYMIEGVPDRFFTEEMDDFGADGWELVTARRARNSDGVYSYECIFKRPVQH
jgi:hypothetical protein